MILTWIIATIIFLSDFLIKAYLYNNFLGQSIPVLKDVLHITVVANEGAAFGILSGHTNFLVYLGIIFILFFFYLIRKEKDRSLLFLILSGMILGGALSNLFDRIFLGFVIDYIDVKIWPVFNLSDSCISVGVGLLLWQSLRQKSKKEKMSE